MNKILFKDVALADLQYLKKSSLDSLVKVKKIVEYLKDNRPPYTAFHAKHFSKIQGFPNCWSMHISSKHRMIFYFESDTITIIRCCDHYNDR